MSLNIIINILGYLLGLINLFFIILHVKRSKVFCESKNFINRLYIVFAMFSAEVFIGSIIVNYFFGRYYSFGQILFCLSFMSAGMSSTMFMPGYFHVVYVQILLLVLGLFLGFLLYILKQSKTHLFLLVASSFFWVVINFLMLRSI